jgi:CDP-glucose 4,6-dehydratase
MAFKWKDHNVLVTGATGLVGSWLTKYVIDEGAATVALVRDAVPQSILWASSADFDYLKGEMRVVHGPLEDYALLERAVNEYEIDTVFHLGAQTIVGTANRNPLSTFEANIRGTYNLLEACRRSPLVKAVVIASSDKAYGDQKVLPYTESTPLQGTHPYDVSKSCADLIANAYFESYGLPVCITRCGNFYGPGDLNFNRIVPGTIRSLLDGERPVIRSDGSYIRDYLYVKDGALAYKRLAERMLQDKAVHGEAFNFSTESPVTVLELVKKITRIMKMKKEPVIMNTSSNEILHQYLSAKKARKILGWKPEYTLEASISETVDWYRRLLKPGARK